MRRWFRDIKSTRSTRHDDHFSIDFADLGKPASFTTTAIQCHRIGDGELRQFGAVVCDDVAGGNSTVGTIVAGLYTAPSQVPNPAALTIKAVATADPSKSAPAQATIRAILKPTVVWNKAEHRGRG